MESPTGAAAECQESKKEKEEEEAHLGTMKMCDLDEEDEEEEEEKEDKDKMLAVDLDILRDDFTPGPEGEVPLASYLRAFHQLVRFVKLMGPLFYFVAYDVKRKMNVVKRKLVSEDRQYYVDVRTMLKYEKENDLLYPPSSLSGSDAVIHLHRGLEFVVGFMKEIVNEEEEPAFGKVASEMYLTTLGRFHPTILARTFSSILLLLPTRDTTRSRISKGNEEGEKMLKRMMPEIIRSVRQTYDACQALYSEHDLLNM